MADTKITALTAITTVDPAVDVLPIVDVSDTTMAASGTTKKITSNQILGAGGTATLASATITGDLTVRTNKLAVTSVGVGIGTATPTAAFDILGGFGTSTAAAVLRNNSAFNSSNIVETQYFAVNSNSGLDCIAKFGALNPLASGNNYGQFYWQIANAGSPTTAMTLNSTGLGVFNSPVAALDVYKAANDTINRTNATFCFGQIAGLGAALLGQQSASAPYQFNLQAANAANSVQFPLVLQPSGGNVGVGVTPSAWLSSLTALQVKGVSGVYGAGSSEFGSVQNCFFNASSQWIYGTTAASGRYAISSGAHQWYTAASGTAGNAITFTQAMTLDVSGNLLVGTTGNGTSARTIISQSSGSLPALYLSGGAGSTPLINFNGAGRVRSDGSYLTIETTNASGVIYMTANTNGVYLGVGGTSWTANSDERLKDIIEPISNAVSKVGSLRSVIGKFKTDETNTRRSFLIAQDVQAVFPEAVDASNPDRLGVAYSEVIPLLVAAIKELTARVQTIEAR
jgi:hypothetical protein